ncbi:Beta-lactamase [Paraburkholderia humisilvae]|uniref:Beta-lactamase n=2 Tax=Paraburkholderia humisilvae TaxID=627669 RepID=A0A6J5F9A5_9BURK|nr:Beta-lactamase [Paraburkholderia humisilvae]
MAPLAWTMNAYACPDVASEPVETCAALAELEHKVGGRLGVYAFDCATGRRVQHRARERFPFCSTSKVMVCAAVLAQSGEYPTLLTRRVIYSQADVASANYAPVTRRHVETGMTVSELCAAAVQHSDNAAANLLIELIGGPSAVTAFARSIGDCEFHLDRLEPDLNTAIPGDARDTTTPEAMAASLRALVLGGSLRTGQRAQLTEWLHDSTTGSRRIRAGVPAGWRVGDKTGTGAYGTTNDVAVLWPRAGSPIVLTVYYTQAHAGEKPKECVIALATRIALTTLGTT